MDRNCFYTSIGSMSVAMLLVFASSSVFSADLDLKERSRWAKEKGAVIIDYSQQYQKILDEMSVATAAIAPKQLDTKSYRPRFEKIQTEMANFIEHTNFDAQHRFKDNPLCKKSIDNYQADLQKLTQNEMDPMQAAFAYSATVLVQCPLSPKVYEAAQKLEKSKSENPKRP